VGCLATIADCDMQQLGVLQLLAHGGQRFRVLDTSTNKQGLVSASIELLPAEDELAIPKELSVCSKVLAMIVADHGEDIFTRPHRLDSATWVGYRLSEVLPIPFAAKQKLLEMDDSLSRLRILQRYLAQRGARE
jgi:Lon protease-like protein